MVRKRKQRTVYSARPGAQYTDGTAQVLGDVVQQLEDRHGKVTPAMLVKAAKAKSSPIHDLFEWDDDAAAQKYRLWQARHHILCLEVEIVIEDAPRRVRAFHNVRVEVEDDKVERGYKSLGAVASSETDANQVVSTAHRELKSWQSRYRLYREYFSGVFAAIDGVK